MYSIPALKSQQLHDCFFFFFQIIKHWLQNTISTEACLPSEMLRGISHFRNISPSNVRYHTIRTHNI